MNSKGYGICIFYCSTFNDLLGIYFIKVKGGVSKKIFYTFFFSDYDEILVSCVKLKKNKIVVEFFKISPLVFEIKAFLWWKIDFLPKKAQILGTYSWPTSAPRIFLFWQLVPLINKKSPSGHFFWISIPFFL